MDYKDFEELLNMAYKESMPNRVDSCPPTP